ncbi:MAG TPA: hypothetical protein VGL13_18240, partial [Polyangiaceae bacterium]
GEATRLSPSAIDKVAAELAQRREAYVIVESRAPAGIAEALRTRAVHRVGPARTTGPVLRPRATLRAEDEEQ